MAATKKAAGKRTAVKKTAAKKAVAKKPAAKKSMPAKGRNPKGGLTQAGRDYYKKTEGAVLKPGVTRHGKLSSEETKRKGSFLRRHFANPRGPMTDDKGDPTRLALSAHAWGEAVPKTLAAAKKLAAKGAALLERYRKSKTQ